MIKTLMPAIKFGKVSLPASKSAAHRQLICGALSHRKSTLICDGISKDIAATANCLNGLGASIKIEGNKIEINPIKPKKDEICKLPCGESGSTLRFMLPLCGALGVSAVFEMEGLLPERPHGPLIDLLKSKGMSISKLGNIMTVSGLLKSGNFEIAGNISSQFVSGLLFALPLLEGDSSLSVSGHIESAAYIEMTENAVKDFGISFSKNGGEYAIKGSQIYRTKEINTVEKDWSNAAFFLCMGAASPKGITLEGMNINSSQGDKHILEILKGFGAEVLVSQNEITVRKNVLKGQIIDASEVPDLVPAVSALAAAAEGETRIIHAERLRYKESDRLKSTADMINALGGNAEETADGLIIKGVPYLSGGTVNSAKDHRIAMAAAEACCFCKGIINITDAECTDKSYPSFWDTLDSLEEL